MIHFIETIQSRTLEIVKEAYDCVDILRDLERIGQAKANVYSSGGIFAASQLDQELRRKYPAINLMLNIADTMRTNPSLSSSTQTNHIRSAEEAAIDNLQQDYCGILCDTAVKKGLTHGLKECIESVD